MKLSQEAIKEFQKVYKEVMGIDIDFDFAEYEAEAFMRILYITLQKYLKKR
jgi:hypothetical protein